MLEPREADIPALFLVLVVLPLVAYILLGKWSEAAKKRERISLLAQLAAAEALRAEAMAAASVVPVVSPLKNALHECARCFGPATTRCARCKSVRYCSGKCQIIHWRQVHKNECQKLDTNSSSSSPWAMSMEEFIHESALLNDNMSSQFFEYSSTPAMMEKTHTDNIIYPSMSTGSSSTAACSAIGTPLEAAPERRAVEKQNSGKSNREMSRREDGAVVDFSEKASESRISSSSCSNIIPPKEAYKRHKLRSNDSHVSEGTSRRSNASSSNVHNQGTAASRSTMHESNKFQSEHANTFEPGSNCGSSLYSLKTGTNVREVEADYISGGGFFIKGGTAFQNATEELNCSSETTATKGSVKAKTALHSRGTKISKSLMSTIKVSGEQLCSEKERKGQSVDESKVVSRMRDNIPGEGSNGVASMGMKMMGLRKSTKLAREDSQEVNGDRHKKLKMLFPYEEFVKFFQCEVFDLSPRGLINCGNSCYANAVLQCLTCTKPLVIYLLCRSHSRACWAKDWCLMCELEQYVMMLRESGGPLSPNRILSHVRRINCQIGDGSQEDAHEYLRLLIASMQSICLEGLGGENKVDPRLQKTTFIQHTFGGSLRSKVKCLICHHESERYENIMDLTLEIYGWVESLEDALTQFTTPEDLDGENMYRCGRCAAYVRARKQLSVHEAPNVLTIVLKRFQEGRYGKLNKCITFPDMLDMIPFMTGVDDMPPLYMLYAVVVHLDTLNASFSGHYVSYVKDLQGNWYRVDDTEVQLVPVSQVMSEGAYILFYIRSCPRPQRAFTGKALRQQTRSSARHCPSKAQKSSGPGHSKPCSDSVGLEPLSDLTPQRDTGFSNCNSIEILRRSANRSIMPTMETFAEPVGMEFSDATSSDWSLFTSSDEASFTTESARDSFSTVDYADACTIGPIASIYRTLYASDYSCNKVSCRKFSSSKSETRFVSEEKGYVLDSYLSTVPIDRFHNPKQVTDSSTEFSSVKYGSNPKYDLHRTSSGSHCKV